MTKFEEPLLAESEDRFVIFPLQYAEIYSMYKTAEASLWSVEDIPFDSKETINTCEAIAKDDFLFFSFINSALFLLQKERIFPEEILTTLNADFQATEVRFFYGFKIMTENVHKETLNFLAQKLIETRAKLLSKPEEDLNSLCKDVLSSQSFISRQKLIQQEKEFHNKFGEFLICDEILLLSELLNMLSIINKFMTNISENGFGKAILHILTDKLLSREFNFMLLDKYLKNKMDKDKAVKLLKGLEIEETKNNDYSNYIKTQIKKIYNKFDLGEEENIAISHQTAKLDANEIIYKWLKLAHGMLDDYRYKELNKVVQTMSGESQDFGMSEDF